jgi:membrane-associated phospholipid phosphatase
MAPHSRQAAWYRQLGPRIRQHTFLKIAGTTVFMSLFFVGYFHVLRHPVYAVTQMPLTALDRAIGFYPPALAAYVSLWVYVVIPPSLLLNLRELIAYGWWIGGLCMLGLTCFFFWPTAVPPHALDFAQHPGFQVLQGIDASANACPSLHVGTAVFSSIWLDRLLWEMGAGRAVRALNWGWVAAIAYSTLAIKQHVALDVYAGILLGAAMALAALRCRPAQADSPGC